MKKFIMKMFWILGFILLLWVILAQSCLTMRQPDSDAKKKFEQDGVPLTTATILVDGHHLHYVKTGNDSLPTLFFVHGTPGSWDAFENYLKDKDLLQRFRMVSIDRPGFGYSDYGKPEHLAKQSELISPLFTVLNNHKPMFLAGHSLGGPMVVKLAADNPTAFSGVVIISGSIDPGEEKPEKWRPILYKTPLTYFVPGAMRPSNEELWYLKKDLVDLKNDFPKITCPVYFIHGAIDTWVPPGNIEYGKKLLVHSSHVEQMLIPGANHFIPWTKFNEIKQVLLKLY
ncbi:MAG TPA: alpha/beta hydrolase [Puia sp.]|jgi:pimeloyl-ACP methyl ester carboxylesterase|nr:alpha/beta hydrolase [Puia sp.]